MARDIPIPNENTFTTMPNEGWAQLSDNFAPTIFKIDDAQITSVDLETKTVSFGKPVLKESKDIGIRITQNSDQPALQIEQNNNTPAIVIRQGGYEFHSETEDDQLIFKKVVYEDDDSPDPQKIIYGDTVTVNSPLPFEPLSELSKKQAAHDRLGGQIKADGGTIELDPSDQKLFLTTNSTTTNLQWDEDFGQTLLPAFEPPNATLSPRHSHTLVPQKVDPNHKTLEEAFDFSDEDWNEPEELITKYDDFIKKLETQTAARMVEKSLANHARRQLNILDQTDKDILKASVEAFVKLHGRIVKEGDIDPTGNRWGWTSKGVETTKTPEDMTVWEQNLVIKKYDKWFRRQSPSLLKRILKIIW